MLSPITGRFQQRLWRTAALLSLVLLACFCLTSEAHACPTCKEAIAGGGDETANMVTGYFWSIIFMLSVPAMIFCGLGSYFYLLVHRARRLDPTGEHRQLSILNQPLDPEHRKQLEELAHAP